MRLLALFLLMCSAVNADTVVLYENQEGGVSVVKPMLPKNPGESDVSWIARVIDKSHITGPFKIVDSAEIPPDRYFREAWTLDKANARIRIPRVKAELCHKKKLKERATVAREIWLTKHREAEATEDLELKERASERLKELKSVDQMDLSTCTTLEEVKSCVPDVLKE